MLSCQAFTLKPFYYSIRKTNSGPHLKLKGTHSENTIIAVTPLPYVLRNEPERFLNPSVAPTLFKGTRLQASRVHK